MTVKELIEELEGYGGHVEVKIYTGQSDERDSDITAVDWREGSNAVVIDIT